MNDPIPLPPFHIVTRQEEHLIRVELRAAVNSFLNTWRIESEAGINQINLPAREQSTAYAWIALAGNVLWASASLVPQTATARIAVMSFVGAGVPAIMGLRQAYEDPDPTEANIRILRRAISMNLASAKDSVDVSRIVNDAFVHLITERGLTTAAARERGLWEMMFNVPYERRAGALQNSAYNKANRIARVAATLSPRYEGEMAARGTRMLAQGYAVYGMTMPSAAMSNPMAVTQQQASAIRTARSMEPFDRWFFRQAPYLNLAREFGLRT